MTKKIMVISIIVISITAALNAQTSEELVNFYPFAQEYDEERSLIWIADTPEGYERFPQDVMTLFQVWLTNIPLLPSGSEVKDWQGNAIGQADSSLGILDLKIDKPYCTDVDFPIILYLHYFNLAGTLEKVRILITRTDTLTYEKWLNGECTYNKKDGFTYTPGKTRVASQKEFQGYLDFVTKHLDAYMLARNVRLIKDKKVRPGNMYIQTKGDSRTISHVAMILDICRVNRIEYKVLVAYGGDPAQSIVVPRAWESAERKWMTIPELREHLKEFGSGSFYRFTN
jgi:hypothetical protein